MEIMEGVMIGTQVAIAIGTIIIAITLFYHRKAVLLQRQSLQANLFSEVLRRIHDIQDQQKDYEDGKNIKDWYVRLFDAFEYFAFCANHHYLSPEMELYYESSIVEYYDHARGNNQVVEYLSNRPRGQLNELAKYYKRITGENPPF